jgi:OmpA-OmpF porin, OOP family
MSRWNLAALAVVLAAAPTLAQEQDVEGAKDHPLLSRMPGYVITQDASRDFDSVDVSGYLEGVHWEGKVTRLGYSAGSASKPVSFVQLVRNYQAAVKKLGGKVLSVSDRTLLAEVTKGGGKTWVKVEAFNEGHDYELVVVESKPMEEEVVADAAALQTGLAADGRVALYGVFFDTGKAVVKAESGATLEQVAKLLAQQPRLQLFVVGHTDGVGSVEANVKLSADRAAAVVAALTSRGVAASRLKAAGVGPWSPVATNRTDAGRARNRRVELVER